MKEKDILIEITINGIKYRLMEESLIQNHVLHRGYKAIGWSKDLTEEQAASIVEKIKGYDEYIDYEDPESLFGFYKAIQSFKSLLDANYIDESKNYLLLKEI